jgi:hypothetical protein
MALLFSALHAAARVDLELHIPPAETYVVGDAIPLIWRFTNRSTTPLGFMWEGCCRLNGKVEVFTPAGPLPTAPPGTALAHMFARADRLDPDVPKEYETLVSDWVELPGTGTYQVRGTYRGVLPTQTPQVPRGLALWRDAATSGPVRLTVLAVGDYIAQRDTRARRRGLELTLTGPDHLPPLTAATFHVTFRNLTASPQTISWPDDAALWVLSADGRRAVPSAVLSGATRPLVVPATASLEQAFLIEPDRFEGEPLGPYRLFINLAAGGPGQPRVPSNTLPLAWELERAEVAALLEAAATGAGTGARNAPLKLLRVYLAELRDTLATLDLTSMSSEARDLSRRLSLAAALKEFAPKPGRVELVLDLPASDPPRWADPIVASVAARCASDLAEQFVAMHDLRRHLGWEIALLLRPDDSTSIGQVLKTAERLTQQRPDLGLMAAAAMEVPSIHAPVRLVIPLAPRGKGATIEVTPTSIKWSEDGREFQPVTTDADLLALANAQPAPAHLQVKADATLLWNALRHALRPLLTTGTRLVLTPRDGE